MNTIAKESPEEKAAWTESLKRIMAAREAIMKQVERLPSAGKISPCPVCERGELHYTVTSNGHVHARCITQAEEGCVSWAE